MKASRKGKMQILDKIIDKMWNYIVSKPMDRSLHYIDKHQYNLKADKLASMGLGMDSYIALQAKAQAKTESIIGNADNSSKFKLCFTFFFYLYRFLDWLKKPFFLFEVF